MTVFKLFFSIFAFYTQSVLADYSSRCPDQTSSFACGLYDNCLWTGGACVPDECREDGNLNDQKDGCVDTTKCTFYNCPQLDTFDTVVTYLPQCVKKGADFNSCANVSTNYYYGSGNSGIDTARCTQAGCSITGLKCTGGAVTPVAECSGNKVQCESDNHCKWVGGTICMGCNDYNSTENSCLDAKYVLGVTCKWSSGGCVYDGPLNYECDKLQTAAACGSNQHCAWMDLGPIGTYCTGCDEWDIAGQEVCEGSKELHGISCKWSNSKCEFNETIVDKCNPSCEVNLIGAYHGDSYCEGGTHTAAVGWTNLTIGYDLTSEGRPCPYRIDHDGIAIGWADKDAFEEKSALGVGCCVHLPDSSSSVAHSSITILVVVLVLLFF